MDSGVQILAPVDPSLAFILSPDALAFLAALHRQFNPRRRELLQAREERQAAIDGGAAARLSRPRRVRCARPTGGWRPRRPIYSTGASRSPGPVTARWSSTPSIPGPRSSWPTWRMPRLRPGTTLSRGKQNLYDAVRRTISFENPDGRVYRLNPETATLLLRPRGWHLDEAHITVDGEPASGSLVDFGLYFFHNARELIARGTGPYFYLPKLQSHRRGPPLERRLHLCPRGAGDPQWHRSAPPS